MDQAALGGGSPTIRLVIVPVLISLVVTLWRLTGELLSWLNPAVIVFSFTSGGGGGGGRSGYRHHLAGTDLRNLFRFTPRQKRRWSFELGKGDRLRRDRFLPSPGGWSRSGVSRSKEFPWGAGVHLAARCTDRGPPISRLAAVLQDGSCLRVGRTASGGPHYGPGHARIVGHSLRRHPPRIPGDGLVGELYVAGVLPSTRFLGRIHDRGGGFLRNPGGELGAPKENGRRNSPLKERRGGSTDRCVSMSGMVAAPPTAGHLWHPTNGIANNRIHGGCHDRT